MKKLGRGWQYTTYDIGGNRVLKKLNSKLIAYCVLLHDCFPYITHPFWKFPTYYKRCKSEAAQSLESVKQNTINSSMLGNPVIHDDLSYEQDMLTPLRICLERGTVEQGEKIIDDFAVFNKILIEHSIIDRNFLITDNFGMNSRGEIVLMDLGELYFNKEMIQKHITEQPWKSEDVILSLPKTLRAYFIKKMDESFPFNN